MSVVFRQLHCVNLSKSNNPHQIILIKYVFNAQWLLKDNATNQM